LIQHAKHLILAVLLGCSFNASAQVDSIETEHPYTTAGGTVDSAIRPTWYRSPIHRKFISLLVQTDAGKFRGVLLAADEEIVVLWSNPHKSISINDLNGNIQVFRPNEIVRIKSLSKDMYVNTVCGTLGCGAMLVTGSFASAGGITDDLAMCCLPVGCSLDGLVGDGIA
jgi:hypothetical protein